MKKIPTVLVRDITDRRFVTDDLTPGCEWVLEGEGVVTRKYDGTCVMFNDQGWWARREVKAYKEPPPNFKAEDFDEVTKKTIGWEPASQSGFVNFLDEALTHRNLEPGYIDFYYGTYELAGPKINNNPEGLDRHILFSHAHAERPSDKPTRWTIEEMKGLVTRLKERGWEGVVWHHPDGRMAKLKSRDIR